MKPLVQVFVVLAWAGFSLTVPSSATAVEELPGTFVECVLAGGDIRLHGDLTCRFVQSSDLRIYLTAETECGEMVDVEIWEVTRRGVQTYPFAPERTKTLPEVGEDWSSWPPASPIPCLKD